MKKNKIKLSDLKVISFRTDTEDIEELKGGRWSVGGAGACPHTGDVTMDYLGCNSLNDFYCRQQSGGYLAICSGDGVICDAQSGGGIGVCQWF